ncbi:MAG: PAS domain S-box protein [Polyangiaceae bacterium]
MVVEHMDDAVAILVADEGQIVFRYVNPAFERTFGHRADDVVGRPVSILSPNRPSDALLRLDFDRGHPHRGETRLVTRDGDEVWVEVQLQQVALDGEPAGLLVMRDVTEYRRLEHITDASAVADSVGYVFAGLRHELGNPLNSLKTTLYLLTSPTVELTNEERLDFLRRCGGEVARMEQLLEQMRTFNANEHPHVEPIELSSFLGRFVRLTRPTCEANQVEMDLAPIQPVWAYADGRLLQQILSLLLSNAIDALPADGNRRVSLDVQTSPRRCVIHLSDSGVGMTEQQLEVAQRPFMSTKRKGTGLGLPLARRYATLTRCDLTLESEFGVGTRCSLDLERVKMSERPPE